MKLIVQIPCYNEEESLPLTLSDIPRQVKGVDSVEVLVVDDGSTDRTVEIARAHGCDHIVKLESHRGLAVAFYSGLHASLLEGAHIIVNMDADHSFKGQDLPRLIEPILSKKAALVLGVRPIKTMRRFSGLMGFLQQVGSWAVSWAVGFHVPDPTSGFRAYSREAALRLNASSGYSYVIESIIQAVNKGLPIAQVRVYANEPLRESRLIKSIPHYIFQSAKILIQAYLIHNPVPSLLSLSCLTFLGGAFTAGYWLLSERGRDGEFMKVEGVVILITSLLLGLAAWIAHIITRSKSW